MTAPKSPVYKILVVDDDPDIVELLEFNLKKEGYQTASASDGRKAMDIAADFNPDIILLDVMMPKKSGFEVCQAVRANEELQATKILMLTAKGRDTDRAKGLALGADAYMTKPFSTRELVQKVAEMLQGQP